jgi:hypothetical protein
MPNFSGRSSKINRFCPALRLLIVNLMFSKVSFEKSNGNIQLGPTLLKLLKINVIIKMNQRLNAVKVDISCTLKKSEK